MNYIAGGIIVGIILISLATMYWMNKKESTIKKKVKTVEELYPGVPFKKKDETLKAETSTIKKPVENIEIEINAGKVVRLNDHVKHPYKRKRNKNLKK